MRCYYCLLLLLLVGSCRTVSMEQRKIVQQFADKTESYAASPERIWTELAGIRESRGVYYANSFTDPASHLQVLDAIVKERLHDDSIPGRIGTVFKILDRYASGLAELSSDSPSKNNTALLKSFGVDLESLIRDYNRFDGKNTIPAGVGTLLAQSLDFGVNTWLANRQCKAMRKYVSQADPLVATVCDAMADYLSSDLLSGLIRNEASGVGESFLFYFTKRSPPALESEMAYLSLMKRVEAVKELQQQSVRAAKSLKKAHAKLAELLGQKRTLNEITADLVSFYSEVEKIQTLVAKLKHNKEG